MKMSELSEEIKLYKSKGQEIKHKMDLALVDLEKLRSLPKETQDPTLLAELMTATWNEIDECYAIIYHLEGYFFGDGVVLAKDALDIWQKVVSANLSYLWTCSELLSWLNGKCQLQTSARPQYYDRPADFYNNLDH